MEEFTRALRYAYLLLKYRRRSSYEVSFRLGRKGFSPLVVEKVLGLLRQQGYIDDESFVAEFVKDKLNKGWGKNKIYFILKNNLGLDETLINEELNRVDTGEYYRRIRELIQRKLKNKGISQANYEVKGKLFRYLIQRGFPIDDIKRALEDENG